MRSSSCFLTRRAHVPPGSIALPSPRVKGPVAGQGSGLSPQLEAGACSAHETLPLVAISACFWWLPAQFAQPHGRWPGWKPARLLARRSHTKLQRNKKDREEQCSEIGCGPVQSGCYPVSDFVPLSNYTSSASVKPPGEATMEHGAGGIHQNDCQREPNDNDVGL